MNYSIIKNPPKNVADYVKVPGTDCREDFLKSLGGLFKNGVPYIYTDPISIEWAVTSEKIQGGNNYHLMMLNEVPVNFGEIGTAYGVFYFERKPKNSN